jgi:hypothetical protein
MGSGETSFLNARLSNGRFKTAFFQNLSKGRNLSEYVPIYLRPRAILSRPVPSGRSAFTPGGANQRGNLSHASPLEPVLIQAGL